MAYIIFFNNLLTAGTSWDRSDNKIIRDLEVGIQVFSDIKKIIFMNVVKKIIGNIWGPI